MSEQLTEPGLTPEVLQKRVRDTEILISYVLRIGVLLSLVIVVAGLILSFTHHPTYFHSSKELVRLTTVDSGEFPDTIGGVWDGLKEVHGQAIIMVGLILLILTPVVRVAVSILAFVYEHDSKFVIFTTLVLALLILAFFLGAAG